MSLRRFLLKRALLTIITVLGSITVVFFIIRLIPGDPVAIMLGQQATGEAYEELRHFLGLDQPIYVQFLLYLERILMGDWGRSITTFQPVLPYVLRRFWGTLELTAVGLFIASVIGITSGAVAAMKEGTKLDSLLRVLSLSFYSIPVFWLGLILILIFAVYLGVLPAVGGNVVLPALTLGIWSSGAISRISRASLVDVKGQQFVLTAVAKGVSPVKLFLKHILRNALLPIVTIIALQFGKLLGGAMITEMVFSYPGVGSLIVEGLLKRDYPVVQGGILLTSVFVCMTSIFVDIIYPLLDPRITSRER